MDKAVRLILSGGGLPPLSNLNKHQAIQRQKSIRSLASFEAKQKAKTQLKNQLTYMINKNAATWPTKIAGCFGCVDLEFALHSEDEQRAQEMFRAAFTEGASINEVLEAIKSHITTNGGGAALIQKQLDRATNLKLSL